MDADSGAIKRAVDAHKRRITQRVAITVLKFNQVILEEARIKARDPRNKCLRLYEARLNQGRSFSFMAAYAKRMKERAKRKDGGQRQRRASSAP
jgi:hypothetical protein